MVTGLLNKLARLGVVLYTDNNKLIYHYCYSMPDDLLKRLRDCKAEVLAVLANPWPETVDPDLSPCEGCGGLELWETLLGRWRCVKCDPPEVARRLLVRAERIRAKGR